jgi:hypothetical protein
MPRENSPADSTGFSGYVTLIRAESVVGVGRLDRTTEHQERRTKKSLSRPSKWAV